MTHKFAGILYPSTRLWANGDNLALLPWFADSHLEFRKALHVRIRDRTDTTRGQKLYDLKGSNIYKLNGDLVGHLSAGRGKENRLDKATDKLFPST